MDPATGAVYVCVFTGTLTADVVKFSGLEGAREVCRIKLPRTGMSPNAGNHRIAVDASAKPVRIWVPEITFSRCRLKYIEDAGEELLDRGDPRSKDLWAEGPRDLFHDGLREELYIKANGQKYYRVDGRTGEVKDTLDPGRAIRLTAYGIELKAGADGNLYTNSWGSGLWRLDRKGKLLNWEGQKTANILMSGIMCFQERHLALRPFASPEEFYLVAPLTTSKFTSLNVYGQDGKARRTVVWQCLNGAIPRVDRHGNIYLAELVKPPDQSYPRFFDGKIKPPPKSIGGGDRFWYSYMYGSIIKFPPSGGIIWHQKNLPDSCVGKPPAELLAKPRAPFKRHFSYEPHLTGEVQGALWTRFGYSPYSAHMSGSTIHCMCEGSGFDVDPFGRVFFPNLGRFRVEVIDTNNNPITTFGKYGNEDSGGKGAKVAKPEIPFAWPTYVAVSDTHAYVGDTVSRRVVKVKLAHAAEETCEVK